MSINKSIKSNSNHKTFGITTFRSVAIEKPLNDDDVFSMFNIYAMFASNEYLKIVHQVLLEDVLIFVIRIHITFSNKPNKM